jgi:dephospho-CoA kinase
VSPEDRTAVPPKPWVLGLTGGIASGKSTAAREFAALGVPIIDLDEIGREILSPASPTLTEVFARFGSALRQSDGSLDRRALRQIIFADPAARRALEDLTHPAILRLADARLAQQRGPYVIIINPLLIESGDLRRYQRILVVDCPETLQLERLRQRDGSSAAQAQAMLAAQSPRAARLAAADDVIRNDTDLAALVAQVKTLHAQYLKLAENRPAAAH